MDPVIFMMYLCFLGSKFMDAEDEIPVSKTFRKVMDGSGEDYNWEYFTSECRTWRAVMGRKYKGHNYKLEQAWRAFSHSDLLTFAQKYWNTEGSDDGEA